MAAGRGQGVMRILLVAHGFPPRDHGGSELYAQAHAEAFARAGDAVLVVAREADATRPEFAVRREAAMATRWRWVNNTFARRARRSRTRYTDDRDRRGCDGLRRRSGPTSRTSTI